MLPRPEKKHVWNAIIEDQRFWHKEVEEPCLLVKAKSATLQTMVEADAPIGREAFAPSEASEANPQVQKTRRLQECMRKVGEKATDLVWERPRGLEWTVPSPAPYHTFDEPPTSLPTYKGFE